MTLKERRHAAMSEGWCGSCRCRKPEPGKKTCEVCLAHVRRRDMRTTSDDWLVCCQTTRVHRRDCTELRETKTS